MSRLAVSGARVREITLHCLQFRPRKTIPSTPIHVPSCLTTIQFVITIPSTTHTIRQGSRPIQWSSQSLSWYSLLCSSSPIRKRSRWAWACQWARARAWAWAIRTILPFSSRNRPLHLQRRLPLQRPQHRPRRLPPRLLRHRPQRPRKDAKATKEPEAKATKKPEAKANKDAKTAKANAFTR